MLWHGHGEIVCLGRRDLRPAMTEVGEIWPVGLPASRQMSPPRSGGAPGARAVWMPHSVFCEPAQRPERTSLPASTGLVQGQQPIEG